MMAGGETGPMYNMLANYFLESKKNHLLEERLAAGLTEHEREFFEAAEIGNLDAIKSE